MEIDPGIPQLTKLSFDGIAIEITSDGKSYTVSSDRGLFHAEVLDAADGRMELLIDGQRIVAYVSSDGQGRWVTVNGRTARLTKKSTSLRLAGGHDGPSELTAPMPGQVRAVNVSLGDHVTKGQVLVVLEAMKMEIRLQAPFDGEVSSVDARLGQTVEREQVLVKLRRPQG